ncbi:PP2C family protein-serine/threonine phosphatase [Poseidonocella sedimentorum]|nr:SpoIIE family protein phosphatase [Poseidonocella sedimentorum]
MHVLVVDDSSLQRRILSNSLAKWGFRVTEADGGLSALEVCRADPPELVISDWMMPGMNGLEFCCAFRQLDLEGYGYFILLTSNSDRDAAAEGLDAGADDFLPKPVHILELRARISAGLRILTMQKQLSEKNRLISATLSELQTVYDALDNDLAEARKLQQSLLREPEHSYRGGDVTLMLRPSGHVGGDLVGYFPLDESRIAIFAIDVSGHGISSALVTARLAGHFSDQSPAYNLAFTADGKGGFTPRPAADVVRLLNDLVIHEMDTEHYLTFLLAYVDQDSGAIEMVQAGHPCPMIQRACGRIDTIGEGGFPVGLLDEADFETVHHALAPGDRLLILSDGFIESANPSGQMLGEDGFSSIMEELSEESGTQFLSHLSDMVEDFADGQELPDDISAALWEFRGTGA